MAEIGSLLRETRMRERIDITTVESATKIRAKYLRALENEEWDQLPGPTFVRTFLRTYAEYLGLDPKMLVEDYKQRFERTGAQDMLPFAPRPGRRPPRPSRGMPPWVVVGVAVVLLIGVLFALGSFGEDPAGDGAGAEPTATATAKPKESKRRARKRRRAPAPKPTVVSARIVPEGTEVYVCLVNVAGDALIDGETLSDTPSRTYRSKRMRVTFGNGAVKMRVNGKTYGVPESDEAIGYSLQPGKRPERLSDGLPTCA